MKRFLMTLAIAIIVCIICTVSFTACKIELTEMDGTEYYTSTEKEHSVELVNEFFEEILKDPDFVATCVNADGDAQYTETVKGESSYTLSEDGSKTYAFKNGGSFYAALISKNAGGEEESTYLSSDSTKKSYYAGGPLGTMEEIYKNNHCAFMNDVSGAGIVSGLPEEDATFSCQMRVERISGFATSSLDFTYTSANKSVTISASAEEKKVQTLHVVINEAGEDKSDLTWTFSHGGASLTLPDIAAWN